ncbi:MAG TPA: response regulator [bacterium]|nr:response regulator [bacterium]
MKILVIEDDPLVRESMERMLTRAGHEVCWAATGTRGLAMMREEKPDLVFLDLILGDDMNGWELARDKRDDPEIAAIPAIVLTGLEPRAARIRGEFHESMLSEILLIMSKPPAQGAILKAVEHIGALKKLCA